MFEWFWEFLYKISKTLMYVCDLIMYCAKALIGVDDIVVDGESTDFLTYLIRSEYVSFAFGAAFSIAVVVIFLFAIIAIIRNGLKEQPTTTPIRIVGNILKNILYFTAVPVLMIAFTYFMRVLLIAVDSATSMGNTSSIGSYLFTVFARDADLSQKNAEYFLSGALDYTILDVVKKKIDIEDFNYIMCWIVSGFVLYNLASSLVTFVERSISIVVLYVAAPFSIAASELDDGARFKTWRDQVISKFLAAYGILIALNIYIMLCGLVLSKNVVFFDDGLYDDIAKLFIIIGGALSMRKIHSLIGTLISPSAASDINDPNNNAGRGLLGKLIEYSPLGLAGKGLKKVASMAIQSELYGGSGKGSGGSTGDAQNPNSNELNPVPDSNQSEQSPTNSQNTNNPKYNSDNDLREALGDDQNNNDNSSNQNVNAPQENKDNTMSNVIKNSNENNEKKNDNKGDNNSIIDDEDLL